LESTGNLLENCPAGFVDTLIQFNNLVKMEPIFSRLISEVQNPKKICLGAGFGHHMRKNITDEHTALEMHRYMWISVPCFKDCKIFCSQPFLVGKYYFE